MKKNNIENPTYISLFSSAGVGCYGFKKAGFDCIATNELIERRLNVQRNNNKCKYESGYICGDITTEETKKLILSEIKRWEKDGLKNVDVVIATPPCQGMSVANHKKSATEINRNSLVVESIKIINEIHPNFFIFENVAAFMKTGCTAPDKTIKEIGTVIYEELGSDYIISHKILNFKNYGSNSSRTRTIVIGVSKKYADYIAPIELFPKYVEEKTLRDIIGNMPKLEWGEFCPTDFYHQFRTYDEKMRPWIHDLKEGQGAFENEDPMKRPHQVVDGKIIQNVQKNGDKYTRQYWDKVAPCIHTRNDQLASQNTIHPCEDRVFSIRELMKIMTIPEDFKWTNKDLSELNSLSLAEKTAILKKEEINIRQSIGEAVPTNIFFQIGCNIKKFINQQHFDTQEINRTIEQNNLKDVPRLKEYLKKNPENLDFSCLSRIAELTNSKRENNSAYFTNKFIVNEIMSSLPDTSLEELHILEPSVGIGNFLPPLMRKYEDKQAVTIDVCDIDQNSLDIVKILLEKIDIPNNITLNFICDDFLLHSFNKKYFLVIGNPPFTKVDAKIAKPYLQNNTNKDTTNLFEFFLEKSVSIANYVAMITPKNLLNTPEFKITRELLSKYKIDCIQDFGEQGFKGVLVETICTFIDTNGKPGKTEIISTTMNKRIIQKQDYIFDNKYPYWLIYRDSNFDMVADKLEFNVFTVFRDRQLTNSNTSLKKNSSSIRIIKSRNIDDLGVNLIDIPGYDSFVDKDVLNSFSVSKYLNDNNVFLTPNMTYKPRVMRKPKGVLVNGSVAILIPKINRSISDEQLVFFSTPEYRTFYQIARNYQTRSLNVDACSVYFYGLLK